MMLLFQVPEFALYNHLSYSYPVCLGRAAVCDCGTPWTFLFFLFFRVEERHKWVKVVYNILVIVILYDVAELHCRMCTLLFVIRHNILNIYTNGDSFKMDTVTIQYWRVSFTNRVNFYTLPKLYFCYCLLAVSCKVLHIVIVAS